MCIALPSARLHASITFFNVSRFFPISEDGLRITSEMKDQKLDGFLVQYKDGLTTIRQKSISSSLARLGLAAFLMFWLAGWSFVCVSILQELSNKFTWFTLLFSIPFFVGWFAGATALMSILFGRQQINIAKDRLEVVHRVIIPISRQEVLFKEIFGLKVDTVENFSSLKVESSGQDLILCQNTNLKRLAALQDFLYEQLPSIDNPGDFPSSEKNSVAKKRPFSPAKSSWYFEDNFSLETVLANKGSFALGTFLGVLATNLFWNGIIGVFIVKLVVDWTGPTGVDWSETFFITPFVLIGLAMMALLAAIVLEPFRKTTYVFSDREIEWNFTYFGIGRTKTWPIAGAVAIGISDNSKGAPEELADGTDYKLGFSNQGTEKMAITSLSLAEAEWIGTQLEDIQDVYSFQRKIT